MNSKDSTANPANLAAIFCHALVGLSSKSHRGNNFFCIFLQSSCQVGLKNAVKYWKDFLLYFPTLDTYCVKLFHQTIVLISTDSNLKTKFEVQNCRLGYGPVRILKQFDYMYIQQYPEIRTPLCPENIA